MNVKRVNGAEPIVQDIKRDCAFEYDFTDYLIRSDICRGDYCNTFQFDDINPYQLGLGAISPRFEPTELVETLQKQPQNN